jgi:hypothetical protein
MAGSDSVRRTIEFRREDVERLESLSERLGTSNQTEALRRAIKIAHALTEPGIAILHLNGSGEAKEVMFL